MHRAVKADLGMQGISSADSTRQRQTRKQCLSDRDLIGFLRNFHLQQRFLALMGTEREQMSCVLPGCSSTTHGFTIQGERIIWPGLQGDSYPVGKSIFNLLCI